MNSSLKTIKGHIVLSSIERAQPYVVPKLTFINTTLHQTPVEPQCHLRLVCVEMIRCYRCNSFNVVIVKREHSFVHREGLSWIIQEIVNSGNSYLQTRLIFVGLQSFLVKFDSSYRLVTSHSYFNKLHMVRNHVLIPICRKKLSLCILNHSHFKLAFANSCFPPPILEFGLSCGFRGDI